MEKLVGWAVTLGITLAAAGELSRATLWLLKQIPPGGPQLISLGKLNRVLQNGGVRHMHPAK